MLQRGTTSAGTTITIYAFGLEEHVYDGSGNHQSDTFYYSLNSRLLGALTMTGTQFYLTDALGSVLSTISAVANTSAVLGNQLYGPYGNQRYTAGTMGTNKGFTEQYADPLSGLDYYNARYYDPVVGRFISADTVDSNSKGMDPYAYVLGNPETRNDPTGHCAIGDNACWQFALGAAAVVAVAGSETGPGDIFLAGAALFLAQVAYSQQQSSLAARSITPEKAGSWDQPTQGSEAQNAKSIAMNERLQAIANTQGQSLSVKEDPSKANVAVGLLDIRDHFGNLLNPTATTQVAFGYRGAELVDHAEPQLVEWAKGEIASVASNNDVANVNFLLYTSKSPCKASCGPALYDNDWIKQLWGALGYAPGRAWVNFHVFSGGTAEKPNFGLDYSRGTNNGVNVYRWWK